MKHYLFFLSIFLFLSQCYSGTIDPNKSDLEYIEYGNKHECVLMLEGRIEDQDKVKPFFASCVIVKPRFIITAAHIASKAKNCYVLHNNKKIDVDIFVYPEEYNEDKIGKNDISIGLLKEAVELNFFPSLYEKEDEIGKVCSMAGFGATGNFITGINKVDRIKRGGSNIVDDTFDHTILCSIDNGKNTTLEFLISQGDSGGGLFIDKKLAGIHSFIMASDEKTDSNYGDVSAHTRISIHKPWIERIINGIERALEKISIDDK